MRCCYLAMLLGACGTSDRESLGTQLQLVVGSAQYTLQDPAVSDQAGTRLLVRVADERSSVLVSMEVPVVGERITIVPGNESLIVWGMASGGQPLIATGGELQLNRDGRRTSILFMGVEKPADSSGERLQISGVIGGVVLP